jgi:hypothetical protein
MVTRELTKKRQAKPTYKFNLAIHKFLHRLRGCPDCHSSDAKVTIQYAGVVKDGTLTLEKVDVCKAHWLKLAPMNLEWSSKQP